MGLFGQIYSDIKSFLFIIVILFILLTLVCSGELERQMNDGDYGMAVFTFFPVFIGVAIIRKIKGYEGVIRVPLAMFLWAYFVGNIATHVVHPNIYPFGWNNFLGLLVIFILAIIASK